MTPLVITLTAFGASPYIDEARQLVEGVQFEAALKKLELAQASTALTAEDRRAIAGLMAHCWAAEGRMEKVEAVYAELLTNDPRAPAPVSGPPRLREAFRRVKERVYPAKYVSLTREPSPPGRVALRLVDPWDRCATVQLVTRTSSGVTKDPVPVDPQGLGAATLPDAGAWFVEARDAQSQPCATLGSAETPFVIAPVETPRAVATVGPPPWVKWVIAAGALGLAGAATASGFSGANSLEAARRTEFADELRANELAAQQAFRWTWGLGIAAGVFTAAAVVLFFGWE
jgi:hypothetical protein